ncbi:dual specificity protein phosphatase PHS1-like [Silene latifolia]|uniref:dual specificity protein phosphatase PHS1-like n=1 Tax=Silene latifolia TaxID=37657 RepID=UPI003D77469C
MLRNDVVKKCQEDNFNTGENRAYTGEDIIYFRFCRYGEARSVYTLQHLGITQVLCLCSNEIGQSDSQFPELFKNRNFSELNIVGGMECLKESTSSSPTK